MTNGRRPIATGPTRHTNTAGSIRPALTSRHRHQIEHCEGEGQRPTSQRLARNRKRGWRCRAMDRRSPEVRPSRAQSPCPGCIAMVKVEGVTHRSLVCTASLGNRRPRHPSGGACMGQSAQLASFEPAARRSARGHIFFGTSRSRSRGPELPFIRQPSGMSPRFAGSAFRLRAPDRIWASSTAPAANRSRPAIAQRLPPCRASSCQRSARQPPC